MPNGSVTPANIRLSLVDGTAFVDFSAAGTLTPYLNGKLTLTDSAGKKAIGYLKAAGSGETYEEKVVDGAFDDAGNWTAEASWSVGGGIASYDDLTNAKKISQIGWSLSTRALYKLSFDLASAGSATLYVLDAAGNMAYWAPGNFRSMTSQTFNGYICSIGIGVGISVWGYTSGAAFTVDNLSFKKVLTPSATGVTITSTPGGTTYNWDIEAGFNYNDSAGYTYSIRPMSGFIGRPRVPRLFQR